MEVLSSISLNINMGCSFLFHEGEESEQTNGPGFLHGILVKLPAKKVTTGLSLVCCEAYSETNSSIF